MQPLYRQAGVRTDGRSAWRGAVTVAVESSAAGRSFILIVSGRRSRIALSIGRKQAPSHHPVPASSQSKRTTPLVTLCLTIPFFISLFPPVPQSFPSVLTFSSRSILVFGSRRRSEFCTTVCSGPRSDVAVDRMDATVPTIASLPRDKVNDSQHSVRSTWQDPLRPRRKVSSAAEGQLPPS